VPCHERSEWQGGVRELPFSFLADDQHVLPSACFPVRFFDCLRRLTWSSATILLFAIPVVADAALSESAKTVSRGDFLCAATKELGLEASKQTSTLPYSDIPSDFEPCVRAAHQHRALSALGAELKLSIVITRIEAVRLVTDMTRVTSAQRSSFRDVRRGTLEEKAASVAVQQGWLEPLRTNYFGATRAITGADAVNLLSNAAGGTLSPTNGSPKIQTIRIPLQGRSKTRALPKSDILETVWEILNDDYLHATNIDEEEAAYRAIEAIVDSVNDPYSKFLRPQKSQDFQTQISGEVSGIGAQVEEKDGVLTVVTPLRGSPAEAAGLKPGDQILAVDGQSIAGLDFSDAVGKIRGKEGTKVTIRIRRFGNEFDITIVRALVRVPEIEITWQGKVAIVKLMQFGRRTETDLRNELATVQSKNPGGVVLDLRNNPGGLLTAAEVVLSNFLTEGTSIAVIKERNNQRYEKTLHGPTIQLTVPMVVLVNNGSASAAEIVAGALQDHKRATIVGEKTFGKGTVQEVLLFNDGSSLKLTVAEWLTPHGRHINEVGVVPDVVVGTADGRDEPLLKALEVLR